ncbi:MAG: hypothetical protein A4E26_01918 [Methanobacterium sp. PtaU1.Bin097]|nr:MAG: hypothetical protein A4E26_01918 [Methanobacterium sp. PtaU1.Bin097]
MGISEKIEKLADEKERERGQEDIENLFNYLESSEVEELDEVLIEIKNFGESGLYERLIKSYEMEMEVKRDRVFTLDELLQVQILRLARDNLRFGGLLTTIFTDSLITAKPFLSIYSFIEFTYPIFTGRSTNWDDWLNIYFSGLDERIIFALDKFDEVELENLPEPAPEYFQMLRKVRWENKKAKKTYDKLTELMFEMMDLVLDYLRPNEWIKKFSKYRSTEDLFIRTIAGCSAVNDDRLEIEAEDVVKAYKTFFKLIKTDVTKYKAIPERLQGIGVHAGRVKSNGYLVCVKCNGYYKLQPGDSPDDFTDKCECGGHLEYKDSLEFEQHSN